MVLVLDDMCAGAEITVRGICAEMSTACDAHGLAVCPPEAERGHDPAMFRKWSRWGLFDFNTRTKPHPICYAVAFDPDGWKRASDDMVQEAGIELAPAQLVLPQHRRGRPRRRRDRGEQGRPRGDHGRRGDRRDRRPRCGRVAPARAFIDGAYMVTTVFRLGGVDTDAAERFQFEEPRTLRRAGSGGAEGHRRVVGLLVVEDAAARHRLVQLPAHDRPGRTEGRGSDAAEFEGRRRIHAHGRLRARQLPGFEHCYVVDVAPQTGVRQTRMLEGEYVVTKDDVHAARAFPRQHRARPRLLHAVPRVAAAQGIDQLLVAGRHYSATSSGAEDFAGNPALHGDGRGGRHRRGHGAVGRRPRCARIDVPALQRRLRAAGADPGDRPPANARMLESRMIVTGLRNRCPACGWSISPR